jgi:hypothetical protein
MPAGRDMPVGRDMPFGREHTDKQQFEFLFLKNKGPATFVTEPFRKR